MLRDAGIEQLLLFVNGPDLDALGRYRKIAGDLLTLPQGLGSVAFSVLVATNIFLKHQDHLRWSLVNYWYD